MAEGGWANEIMEAIVRVASVEVVSELSIADRAGIPETVEAPFRPLVSIVSDTRLLPCCRGGMYRFVPPLGRGERVNVAIAMLYRRCNATGTRDVHLLLTTGHGIPKVEDGLAFP